MATRKSAELDSLRRTKVAEDILTVQDQSLRQQEQIARMVKENDQIKKEIGTVSGTHYDYVKADKVASLQSDLDGLERRYQFEKMRKNDLTKRYQLARIDLLHSRKLKGGVNVEKEQAAAVQRQVEILESRLDYTLGQFNDALSYNKELRDRIDVIREERRVFLRVHRRMEEDLKTKKRLMADHIEKSNRDMDDRDAQLREVERLRAALTEQRRAYAEQLRNMDAAMMDIKAMREEQTEMQLELEAREYEFGERMNDMKLTRSQEDSDLSRRTIGASASGNGEESALTMGDEDCDDAQDVLHVDKESVTITGILIQIKDALGTDDIDDVRAKYLRAGDLNFSMYKHISELSAKKEILKDSIRDLQRLLEEEGDSERQHRALIKSLEEELAGTESKLDEMNYAITQLRDAVQRTAGTAEDVYAHIGCARGDKGTVDGEEKCTEANLRQFLGAIEERATHILIAFQRHHQSSAFSRAAASLSSRVITDSQLPKETVQNLEEEENALTANTTDSPQGEALQMPDDWEAEGAEPIMQLAPQTPHSAVSARNLVRMMELPSASLAGGASDRDNGYADQDSDQIVSHEEIRKQMEARLAAMREREERNQRKKKDAPQRIK
ncbi:hypothetical protein JKF63_02654 [Porcisia hertigi]|uniref:ODAD1 central coiled coil region domain-containing protein n=1 Tax=Porcisia hertigi TaxID=2761500 RepID=A0A836I1C3_9TRYP|nr:hypothetical protein JKF63_02654 [Porcisia hertigi]